MSRPRPPYLQHEKTRHNRFVWYVRKGRGPRIRLHAEFGTPEFDRQYYAALAGEHLSFKRGNAAAGSLAWGIERYRDSSAWMSLSQATRRQRENIFHQVIESAGGKPLAAINEAAIVAGRERRKATPFQARHFLDAMRGLFSWAQEAGLIKSNPAAAVRYPLLKSGEGFPVWTEDDVAAYEQRWPRGTRQRVWLDVLLYSGLRRGDAVELGRQHVRDGIATIRTNKSGRKIEVKIPLLAPLVETLRAGPTGELSFICGINGKPLTKESFGNAFADACRAAGVKKSAHGLRKIGATRAANNGATVAELNAIFGWTGAKMASLYTQSADRARLARGAMDKLLANETATSIPAPRHKVRASERKK